MDRLPDELKLNILRNFDKNELARLCEVNSDFNRLCNDEYLWRDLVRKDFGDVAMIDIPTSDNPWYLTYWYYKQNSKVYVLINYDHDTGGEYEGIYVEEVFTSFNAAKNKLIDIVRESPNLMTTEIEMDFQRRYGYDGITIDMFFTYDMATHVNGDIDYGDLIENYKRDVPMYLDSIENRVEDGYWKYRLFGHTYIIQEKALTH